MYALSSNNISEHMLMSYDLFFNILIAVNQNHYLNIFKIFLVTKLIVTECKEEPSTKSMGSTTAE